MKVDHGTPVYTHMVKPVYEDPWFQKKSHSHIRVAYRYAAMQVDRWTAAVDDHTQSN